MKYIAQSASCDQSDLCRDLLDLTGQVYVARGLSWLATGGASILVILVLSWVFTRLVRRHIPRLVALAVNQQTQDTASFFEGRGADGQEISEETRLNQSLRLDRVKQRATTLGEVGAQVLVGIIWFLAFLMILGQLGLNLAPLLAGAGVVGIALGFGAQQLVRDFLSGIFIIFEDQYGVGDVVTVADITGTVERVSLRTTKLRDIEGTAWFVPNGELKAVGNRSQLWARAVLDIEVSYDTDVDTAGALMKQTADELWNDKLDALTIIAEPEYWGVEKFGADGVTLRLVVRTEPTEQWPVARELRRRIKMAFDDAGVSIPFPQREIWLHQPDDKASLSH